MKLDIFPISAECSDKFNGEKIMLDGNQITGVTSYVIKKDFSDPDFAELELKLIVSIGEIRGYQ